MARVNPATGESLEPVESDDQSAIEDALGTATDTFESWRTRSIEERAELVERAGEVLRENVDEYAELMTREMGKPIESVRGEVEKCAWMCEYYAERAPEHLRDQCIGSQSGAKTFVAHEPLGPVLAVMPWNFPFWQVFRFAAPHLTAGNVGLLKHASNVPGCSRAIANVFERAGYPDGAFQSLVVDSETANSVETVSGSSSTARPSGSSRPTSSEWPRESPVSGWPLSVPGARRRSGTAVRDRGPDTERAQEERGDEREHEVGVAPAERE
jgi:succinate-semialdehyde dehydrogenase/glutarate-semialdehyde dehydrogenase